MKKIKEGKFGVNEAICMVVIIMTTKVFYTSPALLADMVGNAAWYMTIISALTAAVGFAFIYLLLKRFENKDITEIYKIVFGKFLGSAIALILAVFLLLISFATIREFIDVLKVYVMPRSSSNYLIIIFIAVCAAFCYYGLETIARFSRAVAYFLLAGLGIVLILSVQNYNINYIFPFWGHGIGATIKHGLLRSSSYGEVIILAVIASSLQGSKNIKKAGFASIIITAVLISVSLLSFALCFPHTVGAELTSPMYEMAMEIGFGRFLQRLDPVFLFVWIISSFVAVSALMYCSLSIYAKIFNIKDLKPCILPFSIIVFCFVLMPKDLMTVIAGYIQNIRTFGFIIFFVFPFLALIFAAIRKKKGESANA